MSNRDTRSTPYELSADGICYFAYPDGDAPVVTVANYTELRTKNATHAGLDESIVVSDTYQSGVFRYSFTNPRPARGDDGGLVIAASDGGWWVRQFTLGRTNPIELNWFESVVNNFDITTLFKRLAADFTPYFFVRVPDRPMKLIWNDTTTFNWTTTYNILQFRLYESTVPIDLHIASPDVPIPLPVPRHGIPAWKFSVSDFLLGSAVRKASYLDYLLTLSGTWTWDNRKLCDDPEAVAPDEKYANVFPAIDLTMQDDVPVTGAIRCNATKLHGHALYVMGNENLTFSIAGQYRYASGVNVTGPGHFIFESPYVSDECCRRIGWLGTTAGTIDMNTGFQRCGYFGGVVSGKSSSVTKLSGEFTTQFGAGMAYFFWDIIGNSIDDPLVVNIKDFGFSGPNEFGKPAGVQMKQLPVARVHSGKSDGFGENSAYMQNQRFFRLKVSQNTYGPHTGPPNWTRLFFMENNKADDVPGASRTFTKYITFIISNSRGLVWGENGPPIQGVEQELDNIYFMGDGVNPMWADDALEGLAAGKYGQVKYARLKNLELFGIGGTIDTVNCTGAITLEAGAEWVAANLTFSGAARNIIHFDDAYGAGTQAFTVTNLHAPIGSTVTKDASVTATFTLNGIVRALPYTIQAGDLGTAVPAIPPNPLLGATA